MANHTHFHDDMHTSGQIGKGELMLFEVTFLLNLQLKSQFNNTAVFASEWLTSSDHPSEIQMCVISTIHNLEGSINMW